MAVLRSSFTYTRFSCFSEKCYIYDLSSYAKLLVYDYVLLWLNNFLSVLTAIFPGDPGLGGFIRAEDDGRGGDNWSCKSNHHHQANTQCFTGRMPFRALKAKV